MRPLRAPWIALCLFCAFAVGLRAQVPVKSLNAHPVPSRTTAIPGDLKFDHCFHAVLENDRVRVFRVDVPPHGSTGLDAHHHAYVLLSLGKNKFEVSGPGNSFPFEMEDGEMQVLNGGWAHRLNNLSDTPLRVGDL